MEDRVSDINININSERDKDKNYHNYEESYYHDNLYDNRSCSHLSNNSIKHYHPVPSINNNNNNSKSKNKINSVTKIVMPPRLTLA